MGAILELTREEKRSSPRPFLERAVADGLLSLAVLYAACHSR